MFSKRLELYEQVKGTKNMDVYALSMLILPFMFIYGIGIGLWNEYVDKKNAEKERNSETKQKQ